MIITVVGGNGFVGSGILEALTQLADTTLYSISRSGYPAKALITSQVNWIKGDVTQPGNWEKIINKSDWVIDCVGLLVPNPIKGTTYWRNSILPAKSLIQAVHKHNTDNQTEHPTKFLFVSANYAPPLLHRYMVAKHEVERALATYLPNDTVVIYPGIITDPSKPFTNVLRSLAHALTLSTYYHQIRFVERRVVAAEVRRIIQGEESWLTAQTPRSRPKPQHRFSKRNPH